MIEIPTSEMKQIEEHNRFGKIINVKLNSETIFGSEFKFVPINKKIKNKIETLKNMRK